jgi:hypothetical protein
MREHHKPLVRYRTVSLVACCSLFVAFLLFLLVSLSLPIIKTIYILAIRSTNVEDQPLSIANQLRFGVWGVCASSALFPVTATNDGTCFGPMLGYNVPANLANLVGISPEIVTVVKQAILVVLILHPIVAVFSLLTLISSLYLASHNWSICTLILSLLTAKLATASFIIDLALVIIARVELKNLQSIHIAIDFGPAVWMILVAALLTWFAVLALSARACYCFGVRRHHHEDDMDTPISPVKHY